MVSWAVLLERASLEVWATLVFAVSIHGLHRQMFQGIIEPGYYNGLTQKFSYLMVTPSGGRVEFRQEAASNIYNAADSSYAQLKVSTPSGGGPQTATENLTITVTTTDGVQMDYDWKAGAYRLKQIKDRNGNFIEVTYDSDYGLLRKVKDTLGRVINVTYDSEFYPTAITQQWKSGNGDGGSVTHTYATFTYTYTAVSTNFKDTNGNSIGVFGPSDGVNIKVLNNITYADNSTTSFAYNSYGQVKKVTNKAPNNQVLNSTETNLNAPGTFEPDCPRFSETYNAIADVNGGLTTTTIGNTFEENKFFSLGGQTGTATKVEVTMSNAPPHTPTSRKWYHSAGNWAEGLPLGTEDIADGSQQRWTRTTWIQDDMTKIYILNPRPTVSKVGDAGNVKRTELNYWTTGSLAGYGLVKDVLIYDDMTNALQKKSVTNYKDDAAYLSRRIIGLPSQSELYNGSSVLTAKVVYDYDGNIFASGQTISPVQHDNTNYGAGFVVGRGNLTQTTRCDAALSSSTCVGGISSQINYNTAGAPVAQINPLGKIVSIGYADNFNDGDHNTFAYPTSLTDPDTYTSYIQYRYDIGANVEAQSPTPYGTDTNGNPLTSGKHTLRLYDALGRLERQTIVNTGAYTRYEYPTNAIQSKVYSTITAGAGEVLAESWSDGAGRVRYTRTNLPNSASGWSGTKVQYDLLGRVTGSTVPTEINPVTPSDPTTWIAAGDDAGRGFLWNTQEYDWKGRVTKQTNTDGTFKGISYQGCGCAGGQVTTIEGEEIFETAWDGSNPTSLGKRTQKIYADVLGRDYKTEILTWNGGAVYSTTVTEFNGRDQATSVTKTQAAAVSQVTTLTYDGYGRLKTQQRPEQTSATTYNYNLDDSIQAVVDARGASSAYTYNSRGLVKLIHYTKPASSTIVPDAEDVSFTYDDAGNRKKMTDGLGTVDYTYTELSQLKTEKRTFYDTLANAPAGGFKFNYEYDLAGQLRSLEDPYNQKINYAYDAIGRLNAVTGSTAFGGVTNYASNPQYRAWGGLKSLSYGDASVMQMTYDNRLQVASYLMSKNGTNQINKEYKYLSSGELSTIDDKLNASSGTLFDSERFDRSFKYDYLGRVTEAKTGAEARGGTDSADKIPYRENLTYDAFGHTTSLSGKIWTDNYGGFAYSFVNNRNNGFTYDAGGNQTGGGALSYVYDAAGELTFSAADTIETTSGFDGGGLELKRSVRTRADETSNWSSAKVSYFIRSSVLGGQIVNEVKADGAKERGYVYDGAETVIARQLYNGTQEQVDWEHWDASGNTLKYTTSAANPVSSAAELEVIGNDVGQVRPFNYNPVDKTSPFDKIKAFALVDVGGCVQDGIATDCANISGGAVAQCPNNDCSARRTADGWATVVAYGDGFVGYLPFGANYAGGGNWSWQTQEGRKRRQKPTLKPKQPRRPVNDDDLEKPIIPEPWDPSKDNAIDLLRKISSVLSFVENNVKFIGFIEGQETSIRSTLNWMLFFKPCADAFKSAGIPTPAEVIRDRGLTYAAGILVNNSENNKLLGIDEPTRNKAKKSLDNFYAPAFTWNSPNLRDPIITFLKNKAFTGEIYSLEEDIIHEGIHGSGVGEHYWHPIPFLSFKYGHDLTNYDHYKDILKNCTPPEELK